jgi:WD40 repeat protein
MLARTGPRTADKTLPPGALLTFLQKGLQYVGVEESLRQQLDNSKKSANSRKQIPSLAGQQSPFTNGDVVSSLPSNGDMSLLSPLAIASITRKNPPIQLTVPPAAAAAAVKSRLAFEAEIRQQQTLDQRDSFSHQSIEPPRIIEAPVSLNSSVLAEKQVSMDSEGGETSSLPRNMLNGDTDTVSRQQSASKSKDNSQTRKLLKGGENATAPVQTPSSRIETAAVVLNVNQIVSSKRSSAETKRALKKQKTKNGELSQQMDSADNNTTAVSGFAPLGEGVTRIDARRAQQSIGQQFDEGPSEADLPPSALNGPAHLRQLSGSLPAQILRVHPNGSLGEGNRNGDAPSRTSAFQPIRESNGQQPPSESPVQNTFGAQQPQTDVLILSSHKSEVFMCAWNPIFTNLIATGSGDASARIWEMNGNSARSGLKSSKLLSHGIDSGDTRNKDVTTLEWSSDGTMLATGSYDGVARVWDRNGTLLYRLWGHQGPIFSLKWNKSGTFLLSGSYDKTIIVWNVAAGGGTGSIEHQFRDHKAPALDVDWKDNTTFASCSTDKTVHIYNIEVDTPLKIYSGHQDEVNAVKWDYSGRYLASCSDDCTAKVWDVESDSPHALFDFVSHNQEIYTVKWSPTGPGSPNPHKTPLLATASFDGSIRLWNIIDGSCFRSFNQHRDSVYSVAFSPSGSYLASGSLAGQMYIWSIEEDRHVKSYKGDGDIFEVAWNKEETRVAACFSSHVVAVIDFDASHLPNMLLQVT